MPGIARRPEWLEQSECRGQRVGGGREEMAEVDMLGEGA